MPEPVRRPDRWWVIRRGVVAGAAFCVLVGGYAAANSPGWYFGDHWEAICQLLRPACGPFAIAFVTTNYSRPAVIGVALTLAALIALHPVRPHWVTVAVSGLAIAIWFLLGMTLAYTRF